MQLSQSMCVKTMDKEEKKVVMTSCCVEIVLEGTNEAANVSSKAQPRQ